MFASAGAARASVRWRPSVPVPVPCFRWWPSASPGAWGGHVPPERVTGCLDARSAPVGTPLSKACPSSRPAAEIGENSLFLKERKAL